MKLKFDWIAALLIIALIATLVAFFIGLIPYPYGWIVISLLLMFRLSGMLKQE